MGDLRRKEGYFYSPRMTVERGESVGVNTVRFGLGLQFPSFRKLPVKNTDSLHDLNTRHPVPVAIPPNHPHSNYSIPHLVEMPAMELFRGYKLTTVGRTRSRSLSRFYS